MDVIKMERKSDQQLSFDKFISEVEDTIEKHEIHITDLKSKNRTDLWYAVAFVLRGKTKEEYASIVNGLFKERDEWPEEGKMWKKYDGLVRTVVEIGESAMGFRWWNFPLSPECA